MKEFEVKYWYQRNDDYEYDVMRTEASSEEEAIQNIKDGKGWFTKGYPEKPFRGAKDFKVI